MGEGSHRGIPRWQAEHHDTQEPQKSYHRGGKETLSPLLCSGVLLQMGSLCCAQESLVEEKAKVPGIKGWATAAQHSLATRSNKIVASV